MSTKQPTQERDFDDGTNTEVKDSISKTYQYGFVTDIESETAPKGLKRPRIVYISFIVINLLLLIFLKNLIAH